MSGLWLSAEIGMGWHGTSTATDTSGCGVELPTTYVPGFWSVKDAN